MLFNTPVFIFAFLPISLAAYFLAGATSRPGLAIIVLIAASLVFYGWDNPKRLLPLIIASIVFNYATGLALTRRRSHALLTVAVGINLILLVYFKYAGFLTINMRMLGLPVEVMNIDLPIGISFFTFTQIAFLVDTYRNAARERSFWNYALFVSYFPHLVAGPILHHSEMMPQFADRRNARFNIDNVAIGLAWFAFGLFKKSVIADHLAPSVDAIFSVASDQTPLPIAVAWAGAVGYALQIYFDFSGYSDMALGLARMMNIRFPINFFSPYKATSLIDFWRRWHMTLSRFLRDYLYVTLGGNRYGVLRRHGNLFATMLLGGLWHGASWNFVLWGSLHGAGLIANHAARDLARRWRVAIPVLVERVLTLLLVIVAWVPFRAPGLHATLTVWTSMIQSQDADAIADISPALLWTWLAALGCFVLLAPNTVQIFGAESKERPPWFAWKPSLGWATVCGLMFGAAVAGTFTHPSAFLYFRF